MDVRASRVGAAGLVAAVTLGVAWWIGMRHKGSIVVTAQRRINKALLNPGQMSRAGRPGGYAAIIRHAGRTSERSYETPVGAERTDGGFVIALVYGRQTDWVKNVLAEGSATIVHEGTHYPVERPEVRSLSEHLDDFPGSMRSSARLMNVTECVLLHDARP
jgi:deazaflavin-dependent oxidoreductase (nitroreductase family)